MGWRLGWFVALFYPFVIPQSNDLVSFERCFEKADHDFFPNLCFTGAQAGAIAGSIIPGPGMFVGAIVGGENLIFSTIL